MAARLHNKQLIVAFFPALRPRRRHAGWAVIVALSLMLAPSEAIAQTASSPDVKAAFLMNFAKFVKWPESRLADGQPLVIGVLGNNAVADSLTTVTAGKTIDGHAIVVLRVGAGHDPAKTHLLFIGEAERGRIPEVLKRIGTSSVLTVSDAARFCVFGGIIQLRHEDDRVRFDINLDRADMADLAINSKLLALAGAINPTKN